MRTIGKIIGQGLALIAAITMWVFWFIFLYSGMGALGAIIAFLLAPVSMIFPIIAWLITGVFPSGLFFLWGIGIIGAVIYASSSVMGGHDHLRDY